MFKFEYKNLDDVSNYPQIISYSRIHKLYIKFTIKYRGCTKHSRKNGRGNYDFHVNFVKK